MPGLFDDATSPYLGDPEAYGAAQASMAMQPLMSEYLKNVFTGQYGKQWLEQNFGPNANSFDTAMNLGIGFSGGGLATKPRPPGPGLQAPNIGMGTDAPLFDLSNLTQRPDVPQGPIERLPPPAKGIPDWFKAQVEDPANPGQPNPTMAKQYKQVLQLGRNIAGDQNALGWWNTFPLRDRTIGEFGEDRGDALWRSDMNMLSATSPRHDFPANIRQSSYFGNLLAEGQPMPELVRKYQKGDSGPYNMVPTTAAPSGYANFPLHIQNINNLYDPETGLVGNNYPLTNPKPASMSQNLTGNWWMPTIDVRDLRAMGVTSKGGEALKSVDPASLYGYTEQTFHRPLAEQLGLDPAQMQSSTWVGVPEYFKGFDRSGTSSALGTLEDSIRRTAASLGLTPEQAFQRGWLRKEFKLLSAGGLAPGLLGGSEDGDQRPAGK